MDAKKLKSVLTEKQVAAEFGLSVGTLRRMRQDGSGPRYIQITDRMIRYRREDVDNYVRTRTKGGEIET